MSIHMHDLQVQNKITSKNEIETKKLIVSDEATINNSPVITQHYSIVGNHDDSIKDKYIKFASKQLNESQYTTTTFKAYACNNNLFSGVFIIDIYGLDYHARWVDKPQQNPNEIQIQIQTDENGNKNLEIYAKILTVKQCFSIINQGPNQHPYQWQLYSFISDTESLPPENLRIISTEAIESLNENVQKRSWFTNIELNDGGGHWQSSQNASQLCIGSSGKKGIILIESGSSNAFATLECEPNMSDGAAFYFPQPVDYNGGTLLTDYIITGVQDYTIGTSLPNNPRGQQIFFKTQDPDEATIYPITIPTENGEWVAAIPYIYIPNN